MLKYLIAPNWMVTAAKANSIDYSSFLDFNKMSSILSPRELNFYIKCNLKSYADIFVNKNTNRLLKLLTDKHCENQIANQKQFIHYIENYDIHPERETECINYLIDDPINPRDNNIDVSNSYLKAILIGKDVLGFVPKINPIKLEHYSIRRDIYAVMHRYMSVNDIIQSPIFGI